MKFCPKCRSLILPKKNGDEAIYECKCGYNEKAKDTKIKSVTKNKKKEFEGPQENQDDRLPVCEAKCEKCENEQAYYWEIQTRASDEPPTRFFKCTKCKNTWRDYN